MIQDLHSHSYYSFCSEDPLELVIKTAIAGKIDMLGINDHNYGVGCTRIDVYTQKELYGNADYGRNIRRYRDHVLTLKEKYADKINLISGIEVCTRTTEHCTELPDCVDISDFDYCLIENLDDPTSITKGDLFAFAERCGCKERGIAHTDMFAFIKSIGESPVKYFAKMAERGIFWEMNISYDSIHNYREHQYVKDFFYSPEQQDIIRRSGVKLSVGFDGHRVKDYLPERIAEANKRLEQLNIPRVFID